MENGKQSTGDGEIHSGYTSLEIQEGTMKAMHCSMDVNTQVTQLNINTLI